MSNEQQSADRRSVCFLVGTGPGDLGLVTLKARDCIAAADFIAYDYLCNREVLSWARPEAEIVFVGKKAGDHTLPQDQINALLIEKAKEGLNVVRLKGGDPMVFGRGGEEAQELAAEGVDFEIVPGISSTIAGPTYAGIPVTHRDHNTQLTIFTGHEDPTKGESTVDYAQIGAAPGSKVMLMGVGRIQEITDQLIAGGQAADTPIALVRWATTTRQQTLVGTVGDIAEKVAASEFKAPAVAVIGEVVRLREELSWFEKRPLFGRKIAITRTREQASELARELQALGADAYELPTIKIAPPEDLVDFAKMVRDAHTYDWIVFTSPNGAQHFFDLFFRIYRDARELGGAKIAAIGPGTVKKIAEYRFTTDLLPVENFVAEGLIDAFRKNADLENLTVLWVRPEKARTELSEYLGGDARAILDEAIAYRTIPETEDIAGGQQRLREDGAEVITFTSASTVESFAELGLPLPKNARIASIGPVTSAAAKAVGLEVDIEASEHTISGLVSAIREHFASEEPSESA